MRYLDRIVKCSPYSKKVPVHSTGDHLWLHGHWVKRTLYKNKQRAVDFVERWFEDSISFYKEKNKQAIIDAIWLTRGAHRNTTLLNLYTLSMGCYYYEFYKENFRVGSTGLFTKGGVFKLLKEHDLRLPKGNISFYILLRDLEKSRISSKELYSFYLKEGGTLKEKAFQLELMHGGLYLPYANLSKNDYSWGFISTSVNMFFTRITPQDLEEEKEHIELLELEKEFNYIKSTGKCRITHLF